MEINKQNIYWITLILIRLYTLFIILNVNMLYENIYKNRESRERMKIHRTRFSCREHSNNCTIVTI